MAEYIEREALLRNLSEDIEACGEEDSVCRPIAYGSILGLKMAVAYANTIPTADVEEVKHGEWIEWWDDNYLCYCHKCSECGSYPLTKEETMHDEVLSFYCPNCGAKMDGKPQEKEGDVE